MAGGFGEIHVRSFGPDDFEVLHSAMVRSGISMEHPDTRSPMHWDEELEWTPQPLDEIRRSIAERHTFGVQWWLDREVDVFLALQYVAHGAVCDLSFSRWFDRMQFEQVAETCQEFCRHAIREGTALGMVLDSKGYSVDADWGAFFGGKGTVDIDLRCGAPDLLVVPNGWLPRVHSTGSASIAPMEGGFTALTWEFVEEEPPPEPPPLTDRQKASHLVMNVLRDPEATCSGILGQWPRLPDDPVAVRALGILNGAADHDTDRFNQRIINRHLTELSDLRNRLWE